MQNWRGKGERGGVVQSWTMRTSEAVRRRQHEDVSALVEGLTEDCIGSFAHLNIAVKGGTIVKTQPS